MSTPALTPSLVAAAAGLALQGFAASAAILSAGRKLSGGLASGGPLDALIPLMALVALSLTEP